MLKNLCDSLIGEKEPWTERFDVEPIKKVKFGDDSRWNDEIVGIRFILQQSMQPTSHWVEHLVVGAKLEDLAPIHRQIKTATEDLISNERPLYDLPIRKIIDRSNVSQIIFFLCSHKLKVRLNSK